MRKKLIWLLPPNERSSGENKLRIRFLSAKHLFMSKQWSCYFSQIPSRSEAVTPFLSFFLSWSMFVFFCLFFWTFHQEEHVLPEKREEHIVSLNAFHSGHEQHFISMNELQTVSHFFSLWVFPPPFTKKILKQLFIQIKLKPTWKM